MAHLRHCGDRLRIRHLRNSHAAAHRPAGAAGADRRGAGIAAVPDVGRAPVLHSGICRRHFRADWRLPDGSARTPPRADLQHSDLRDSGVPVGIFDVDRDAAGAPLLRVRRSLRGVRGRRRVARGAVPRAPAPGKSAWLYPGLLLARRHSGRDGERPVHRIRRLAAIAQRVRLQSGRPARAVALHAHVGRAAGDSADSDPAVPAGVAGVAAEKGGRHASPAEHRRDLCARAAPDDDRDDDHVRVRVRRRLRCDPAGSADRAGTARGAAAHRRACRRPAPRWLLRKRRRT